MNISDDIQLHDLENIEDNLSTEHEDEAGEGFMSGSASAFMIP